MIHLLENQYYLEIKLDPYNLYQIN